MQGFTRGREKNRHGGPEQGRHRDVLEKALLQTGLSDDIPTSKFRIINNIIKLIVVSGQLIYGGGWMFNLLFLGFGKYIFNLNATWSDQSSP